MPGPDEVEAGSIKFGRPVPGALRRDASVTDSCHRPLHSRYECNALVDHSHHRLRPDTDEQENHHEGAAHSLFHGASIGQVLPLGVRITLESARQQPQNIDGRQGCSHHGQHRKWQVGAEGSGKHHKLGDEAAEAG